VIRRGSYVKQPKGASAARNLMMSLGSSNENSAAGELPHLYFMII